MEKEGISERKVEIRVRRNGRKDQVTVERSVAEGLPQGWIKKLVLTHRTGRKIRKDPYYIDPKSEYIFQSFKDALRYAENGVIGKNARKLKDSDIENDDTGNGETVLLLESAEKSSAENLLEKEKDPIAKRVTRNGRKDQVVVERSSAEGLPQGWIKKLVLTHRTGRKIRRDPYYIDPKSEYIFQSFKAALRYAENGVIGKNGRRVKDSDIENDDDTGNGNTVLLLESAEKSSAEDLLVKEKDPIAKRVTRSQAKASKNEEDSAVKIKTPSSSNTKTEHHTVKPGWRYASSKDPEKKKTVTKKEEVEDITEKRITRTNAEAMKNDVSNSVTRRASKRLAGVELEPTPELKTRTKAQRVVSPDNDRTEKSNQPVDHLEPTLELKTRTKTQRVVSSNDDTTEKSNQPVDQLEPTPELKTRTKVQRVISPDDDRTEKSNQPCDRLEPSLEPKTRTKARRVVSRNDDATEKSNQPVDQLEPTPELKTRTKTQRVVSLDDDDTTGKSNQPLDPVVVCGLKKTNISLNKEVAKSYNKHSSPKPNAVDTSENCGRAELEKIGKPVSRNGSGDKKKMKRPLLITEFEANPIFHLYGYEQKEEMSPVSPLSGQTSATKRDKPTPGKRLKANKVTSPKTTEISPRRSSNKGEHPHPRPCSNDNAIQKRNKPSNDVVRDTCSEVMEKKSTTTNSFSSTFDSTLADLWKDPCIAFAIKTLTGDSLHLPNSIATTSSDPNNNLDKHKGVSFLPEMPGNVAKPGTDIWKDPCIDFAVKTLTGSIPIGLDETGKMEKKNVEKYEDARFPKSFSNK